VHIHISNYDGKEHRAPQNGKMPLGKFLHCLADDNYSGVLSVETAPDALNADDERKCRKALKEALLFCRKNMIM
jgi:sugar phosphate isomerase/epimerase